MLLLRLHRTKLSSHCIHYMHTLHNATGHSRSVGYSCYIDERMAKRIAGTTLKQFIENDIPDRHYLDISKEIMQKLGYMDEYGDLAASRTLCVAMWEVCVTRHCILYYTILICYMHCTLLV
jgi:hypothetical protein